MRDYMTMNKVPFVKLLEHVFKLFVLIILIQAPKSVASQDQRYPTEDINLNELEDKFLQLCDIAVEKLKLPLDLPLLLYL